MLKDGASEDKTQSVRREKPAHGIRQAELTISSKDGEGTGRFVAELEPAALHSTSRIATVVTLHKLRVALSVYPSEKRFLVMLGGDTHDGRDEQRMGYIPAEMDGNTSHEVEMIFEDWKIIQLNLDGNPAAGVA